MTDALTIFATKVVHDWQVPFALALPQSGTEPPQLSLQTPSNPTQTAKLTSTSRCIWPGRPNLVPTSLRQC